MVTFSKNLRYYRRKNRLTQEMLANKIGVHSATTISNWELGNSSPNIYLLAKLCETLNVELTTLVYGAKS
ncbi:helix-turn-helix domain-containing protein [Macrococcus capreoli]|uniref:helix-turn-helix domain-containing protein n=1 Tax=Macrococcus capreoli TaxID=2982690 RepID=UPI003EE75562